MIRPCAFYSNPETAESNEFQSDVDVGAEEQARAEFDGLADTLEAHGIEVVVADDTPHPESRGRQSAVSYFGEMAIFDNHKRTATVVATQPCRLLVLEGQSLKELLLQMPDISFTFLRVLTARVRAAEQELRLRQERQRELEQELARRQ